MALEPTKNIITNVLSGTKNYHRVQNVILERKEKIIFFEKQIFSIRSISSAGFFVWIWKNQKIDKENDLFVLTYTKIISVLKDSLLLSLKPRV